MLQFPPSYGVCTLCSALQSCRIGGGFDASCLDLGFGNHRAHDALVEPLKWTINFHEKWACSSSRLSPGGRFGYRCRRGRRYRISCSRRPFHRTYSDSCDLTESDTLLTIITTLKKACMPSQSLRLVTGNDVHGNTEL